MSQSDAKSPGKRTSKTERLELCAEEGVEELLATVEEQLKKLDERLVKLLAWQRLQQVLLPNIIIIKNFGIYILPHFIYYPVRMTKISNKS